MIQKDEFIFKFYRLSDVVLKTNRTNKIKLLARLLKNSLDDKLSIDEFEEVLKIVDDLSVNEFIFLTTLENYEKKYPSNSYPEAFDKVDKFWNNFRNEIQDKLTIDEEEFDIINSRIVRTGCVHRFNSHRGFTPGTYVKLTKLYHKIIHFIELKEDELT